MQKCVKQVAVRGRIEADEQHIEQDAERTICNGWLIRDVMTDTTYTMQYKTVSSINSYRMTIQAFYAACSQPSIQGQTFGPLTGDYTKDCQAALAIRT